MAKLLDELTRPLQNQCPCGGSLQLQFSMGNFKCNTCGFTFNSANLILWSSKADMLRYIYKLYSRFKERKSDPMNQLPAYYKKK